MKTQRYFFFTEKAKQGLLESKKEIGGNQAFFKDNRRLTKKENTLHSSIFFSFLRIVASLTRRFVSGKRLVRDLQNL